MQHGFQGRGEHTERLVRAGGEGGAGRDEHQPGHERGQQVPQRDAQVLPHPGGPAGRHGAPLCAGPEKGAAPAPAPGSTARCRSGTRSVAHSQHRFPVPSSKLCQKWLRQLFTLRCQRPPKGLGTNKTVAVTSRQRTHVNKRRVCTRHKKKEEKKRSKSVTGKTNNKKEKEKKKKLICEAKTTTTTATTTTTIPLDSKDSNFIYASKQCGWL